MQSNVGLNEDDVGGNGEETERTTKYEKDLSIYWMWAERKGVKMMILRLALLREAVRGGQSHCRGSRRKCTFGLGGWGPELPVDMSVGQ